METVIREIKEPRYSTLFAEIEVDSGAPKPWSINLYESEFLNPNIKCYGLFNQEVLLAFIIFQVVIDEADISNFVVKKDFQDKGYGSKLLSSALSELKSAGIKKVKLEVRESNLNAKHLYEKIGFRVTATRKGYYSDTGELALLMDLDF